MKDESDGYRLLRFVGTGSKAYSTKIDPDHEEAYNKSKQRVTKKLKGIKKCVINKKINHEHYEQCVKLGMKKWGSMVRFDSRQHNVTTIKQRKLALNAFDDKRYLLADGVSTLAYGHYKINGKFLFLIFIIILN